MVRQHFLRCVRRLKSFGMLTSRTAEKQGKKLNPCVDWVGEFMLNMGRTTTMDRLTLHVQPRRLFCYY